MATPDLAPPARKLNWEPYRLFAKLLVAQLRHSLLEPIYDCVAAHFDSSPSELIIGMHHRHGNGACPSASFGDRPEVPSPTTRPRGRRLYARQRTIYGTHTTHASNKPAHHGHVSDLSTQLTSTRQRQRRTAETA